MSEPRILSQRELELVRDTDGNVIGCECENHQPIWIADLVHTALALQAQLRGLEGVVKAARAYLTVVGNDDAELDALVDAVAAYDADLAAREGAK